MITSVWSGWEARAVTTDDDRFDTAGETVGVSLVLRGTVDVAWTSHGRRRVASLSSGMAAYRAADGREHTYRNRWQRGGAAFCVSIPAGQFALVTADEAMPPPSHHRHLFGFADPVVEQCLRSLAAPDARSAGIADATGHGRRLLIRILELQGVSSPRWAGTPPPLPDETLARVRDHVDTRLSGPIDSRSMAGVAGLSLGHFARRFRRTLGVSPGHYVLARRVRAALWKVTAGDAPLADIAREVGFSSQSHMSHAFVRATGLTPGCARRRRLRVPIAFAG